MRRIDIGNQADIRICLVNPKLEGPYPPLGLGYLAAYLLRYGAYKYDIKIIDGNYSNDILKDILDFSPSIVGFSALSPQIKAAVELSSVLREREPGVFQIIGGIHVSADPELTLRKGSFDLAVLGEGEKTFQEIVDSFIKYSGKTQFFLQIGGIAYLNQNSFVITPPRKEIEMLDTIPVPDRSLFNMRGYLSNYLMIRGLFGNKITTIHTSRGCPYSCIFCSCGIVFKKVRYFSIDYVVSEIKELLDKYKVKSLFFTDDTFIINKERVKKLCLRFIDEGIDKRIKWEVQGRANLIDWQDLPLLELMKKAGCVQIDYGFETGSDKILKFLKKDDVSIEFNQRAIEVTKAAGLNVMGTFMVGVPGETENDIDLTEDFISKNKDKIDNFQIFIATPYPGAQLYEICKSRNLVEKDYFTQILKEKQNSFIPFYSDTVTYEVALCAQKALNKLAVQKIRLMNKLKWLLNNFLSNPFIAFKKVYATLIR